MNGLEHQDQPADEQLRRALDGVAGIFEAMLRRSNEHADRLRVLEESLTADRTALQQIGSVFAEVTRRVAPPTPPVPEPVAFDYPDGRMSSLTTAELVELSRNRPEFVG